MDTNAFHVPNYFRDKSGREYATAYLENLAYGALQALIIDNDPQKFFKNLSIISNIKFKPKLLDDTVFVATSRLHPAITAAKLIVKYKKHHDISFSDELIIDKFSKFLLHEYIPLCQKLHRNIFHTLSNHGAIGLMGECIARDFLMVYEIHIKDSLKRLKKLNKKLDRHILLTFNKEGEIWVENLRTKSGLYYTYLHLAAVFRAKIILNGLFFEDDLSKGEIRFVQGLKQYLTYYDNPDLWPYMEMTKIPVLRQLQKLIFPSGSEFKRPRPEGKEGAFVDILNKKVFAGEIKLPFAPSNDAYFAVEGPFPFSSYFLNNWDDFV